MNQRPGLIAVTGATGFVGQSLLAEASRQGVEVRALTRRAQEPRTGVQWVRGDLSHAPALDRLMRGAEAVIHVAGVVNAPDVAGFEAGNVTGTLEAVHAAARAGVPRFVHVSSLSARQPQLSAYGASKRRGEKIVAASGLDWTIVRPPAVFGPRDTEMFELFRAAKWGVVPVPQQGRASAELLFLLHENESWSRLVVLGLGVEGRLRWGGGTALYCGPRVSLSHRLPLGGARALRIEAAASPGYNVLGHAWATPLEGSVRLELPIRSVLLTVRGDAYAEGSFREYRTSLGLEWM